MKKNFISFLPFLIILNSYQTFAKVSVASGISVIVDKGTTNYEFKDKTEEYFPGFNVEVCGSWKINKLISLGGQFVYNRWKLNLEPIQEEIWKAYSAPNLTQQEYESLYILFEAVSFKGSYSMLDFSFCGIFNLLDRKPFLFFYEQGAGYYLSLFYQTKEKHSNIEPEHHFGISFQPGINIGNFEFKPSFHLVFMKDFDTFKWINISIGFWL